MTIYDIHYRDGKVHRIVHTGDPKPVKGSRAIAAYYERIRQQARNESGNRNGVAKIVRAITKQTVWRAPTEREPHKATVH